MKWEYDVRLEGGPADGDKAVCKGPLPTEVFVTFCKGCGDWHWFSIPTSGAELYERDEDEGEFAERRAKYVYTDVQVGHDDDSKRVRHPRPRELQPA